VLQIDSITLHFPPMRAGRAARAVVIAAAAASAGVGCHRHRMDVEYVSSAPAVPIPNQHAAVLLQVVDRRPPNRGGVYPDRVGMVSGKWGIPTGVRVAPDAVPRNVRAATAEALARAGIGAEGGPNRLYATVLDFWEDGFTSGGSHVVVLYQLVDATNRERWALIVRSGTGEPGDPSLPAAPEIGGGYVEPGMNMFTYALYELAVRASAAFATPAFQQAAAH
jgi:hypothetical protein